MRGRRWGVKRRIRAIALLGAPSVEDGRSFIQSGCIQRWFLSNLFFGRNVLVSWEFSLLILCGQLDFPMLRSTEK